MSVQRQRAPQRGANPGLYDIELTLNPIEVRLFIHDNGYLLLVAL